MFTGVPVRSRSDPADAANASGMSSCEVLMPARAAATTTTSGSSAATAPLMLMSAAVAATSTQMTTSSGIRFVPARR